MRTRINGEGSEAKRRKYNNVLNEEMTDNDREIQTNVTNVLCCSQTAKQRATVHLYLFQHCIADLDADAGAGNGITINATSMLGLAGLN